MGIADAEYSIYHMNFLQMQTQRFNTLAINPEVAMTSAWGRTDMDEIRTRIKNYVDIINKLKYQTGCLCMKRISSFMGNNHAALAAKGFF